AANGFVSVSHAEAGGDFSASALTGFATGPDSILTGGDIVIAAHGPVSLGASSAGGLIDVSGNHIDFTTLDAGGAITLVTKPSARVAGVGAITRPAITAGAGASSIAAFGAISITGGSTIGGSIALSAGGDIALGSLAADGNLQLTGGGAITAGTLTAGGAMSINAARAASLGSVDAKGGDLSIAAGDGVLLVGGHSAGATTITAGGSLVVGGGSGDIASGGDVSLSAFDMALGTVTSGGSVSADATEGEARFAAITAANDIAMTATGTATLGSANSGGNTSVTGTAVTVTSGTVGRDLSLTANAGDLAATGALTVGGDAALQASGSETLGTLDADGSVTASTTGNLSFQQAASGGLLGLTAGGSLSGDQLTSGAGLTLRADSLDISSASAGGDLVGRASGGDAVVGSAQGRTISVEAAGLASLGTATSSGQTSASGASVNFGGGKVGGDLALTATGGELAITSAADVGGAISLVSSGGVTFGTLTAAGGDFTINAGAGIAFDAAGAANSATFSAGGAIAGGSITADAIGLTAGGDLSATTRTATGSISGTAGGVATIGGANAGDALALRTGSALTIGDAIGGTVALRSAGGAVIVTHDIESTFSGDGQQAIVSGAAVQIDDVNGVNLTLAQATNGDIDIDAAGDIGLLSAESRGDVNLTSGGDVRVGLVQAGKVAVTPAGLRPAGVTVGSPGPGNISVDSAGLTQGSFTATGDIALRAGSDINLQATEAAGSISTSSGGTTRVFGAVSAGGDISAATSGNLVVASSNASIAAGNLLEATVYGTLNAQGLLSGNTIDLSLRDLQIGDTGAIGESARTNSIRIGNIGNDIVLGGDENVAGKLSITDDEFTRVHSGGDLQITANSGEGGQSIEVRDLAVQAAADGNMSASGRLTLAASGTIAVVGKLAVTGSSDTAITLAGPHVTIDAAAGNVALTAAGGAATGTVDIFAGDFIAATAAAKADIAGLTPADIEARLAKNDGVTRDEGVIQAGTLNVRTSGPILVQNTAAGTAYDQRRGFAVGALTIGRLQTTDGLTGSAVVGDGPILVLNGTVGGKTGVAALEATEFLSVFDTSSAFNGCLIANPAACAPAPVVELPEFDDPARDLIEAEFDPAVDPENGLASQLIDFTLSEQFQSDPLIDDPVTGAGNDDLWVSDSDCEAAQDGTACGAGQPSAKEQGEEQPGH
ncbi:MAG: beta strand repeat-containing protein, partial [Tsuneonella sp.]